MSKWHGGKGSGSRPLSVTQDEYANRWDLIFGRDKAKVEEQHNEDEETDQDEDEDHAHDCESEE